MPDPLLVRPAENHMSEATAELVSALGSVLIGTACCLFAERLAASNAWHAHALFGVRISPTWERVNLHVGRWGGLACALWGIAMLAFDMA